MDKINKNIEKQSKDSGYLLFISPNEKIIYESTGILNDIVNGHLVLTDKKLFFYFISNISRDKVFMATYPYIISAKLTEGIFSSTLIISSRKETFTIKKINKNNAKEFYRLLIDITNKNKSQ